MSDVEVVQLRKEVAKLIRENGEWKQNIEEFKNLFAKHDALRAELQNLKLVLVEKDNAIGALIRDRELVGILIEKRNEALDEVDRLTEVLSKLSQEGVHVPEKGHFAHMITNPNP